MNDIEKAIKEIKNHKKSPFVLEINRFSCDLAIQALEQQIPKKVAYHEYDFKGEKVRINGIDGVPYDLCPNCEINLCTSGMLARRKMNYCQDCGQAIDWSK